MTYGNIVVVNGTDAENVWYTISGTGSGAAQFGSGVLAGNASGAICAVSGYDTYQVNFSPVGKFGVNVGNLQVLGADATTRVTLAVDVSETPPS